MERITARKTLINFTEADWSHMKQDKRSKLHRNTYKIAYPEEFISKAITADKLQGIATITKDMVKNG